MKDKCDLIKAQERNNGKVYYCTAEDCGKKFKTNFSLTVHFKKVHFAFSCSECGKKINQKCNYI